ncbi:MAG TPA: Rossmann-like and DUF2520 domain-containing protein [Candidatus Acidoferrum sp.]
MMPNSLSIVGAGRVGRVLGRRLHELGWKIRAVTATTEANARRAVRFIGEGRPQAGVSRQVLCAKTILLTVPDDRIAEVANSLAREGGKELQGKVILHASGAVDSSALAPLRACGAAVGSMHPLQTFSGVHVPPLEGKVFATEGDEAAVRVARRIARALGGVPVNLAAEQKPLYHAGGAYAAGLVLALEEAGVQALMAAGMKRREAVRALLSLTRQVLEHYEKLGPHKAWTGPLSRGDYKVVAAHEKALAALPPEFLQAYRAVSRLAARLLARDSEAVLRELDEIAAQKPALAKGKGGNA